jgi:BlaI family transcriptional regulator, penicillinase repressor
MDHTLADLGDLEREILNVVWRLQEASADSVRAELSKPLKESTVRTVLRRLEEKGYLTHTVENRTFLYRAAETRGKAAARAIKRISDWFCNGSIEEVLTGMVDANMLDRKELRRIADKIGKRSGGKR